MLTVEERWAFWPRNGRPSAVTGGSVLCSLLLPHRRQRAGGGRDAHRPRRRSAGVARPAAPARARTSGGVNTRQCPGASPVSRSGPIRVRTRRRAGWPMASHIRRTCRFLPSWMTSRRTPGASTPTTAGAVRPSSSSTPCRSARRAPAAGVPPWTSATYSFSTPWDGWVRSCVSDPSLVRIRSPSVSRSSRPTGKTRGSGGTSVQDGGPAVGVRRRRDDVVGLVQQVVDEVGGHREQDPVDLHPGRGHVDTPAQDGHRAVDGHPAGRDQLLTDTPRPLAGAGQYLLQALPITQHGHGDVRFRRRSVPTSTPREACSSSSN